VILGTRGIGLDNKVRKNRRQRDMQKLKDKINREPDPDIPKELKNEILSQ